MGWLFFCIATVCGATDPKRQLNDLLSTMLNSIAFPITFGQQISAPQEELSYGKVPNCKSNQFYVRSKG